jgi:hypothetical protein
MRLNSSRQEGSAVVLGGFPFGKLRAGLLNVGKIGLDYKSSWR